MSKLSTSEIRAHSEGLDMKNLTISDMPSNILLAIFYFLLSYSTLTSRITYIGTFAFTTFGVSSEPIAFIIGVVLGAAGVYMLIGNTVGWRFKVAAFPMLLYLGLSTAAAVYSRTTPGGIEMVSLMTILFLYRDWDADARKRSLEAFAYEQVTKITQLQAELDKLKPTEKG